MRQAASSNSPEGRSDQEGDTEKLSSEMPPELSNYSWKTAVLPKHAWEGWCHLPEVCLASTPMAYVLA